MAEAKSPRRPSDRRAPEGRAEARPAASDALAPEGRAKARPGAGDALAPEARAESRRRVTDARVLGALAHPLRVALLNHLMAFGPRTASECAEVVGASASNCSWHLRQLARYQLVEPVDSADGRERPWRAVATGLEYGGPEAGPAARAANEALTALWLDEDFRLAREFVRRQDEADPDWRQVNGLSNYELRLSAEELGRLRDQLDALIRPYIGLTRQNPPPEAKPVHVSLLAFLRPEAL
jgi:DNA-binding transcriptional ArsR family regulator